MRQVDAVSILYEADRLCNRGEPRLLFLQPLVSILYEADRLCNYLGKPVIPGLLCVSILYEADRLCNRPGPTGSPATPPGFNPLRGRQTLQRLVAV